jgi:hypothetical protein
VTVTTLDTHTAGSGLGRAPADSAVAAGPLGPSTISSGRGALVDRVADVPAESFTSETGTTDDILALL